MKNFKNIIALSVMALLGLSLTACSNDDDLNTNQYTDIACVVTPGGDGLNIYPDTGLFAFRMFLFFQSGFIPPAVTLDHTGIVFQIVNSIVLFQISYCSSNL